MNDESAARRRALRDACRMPRHFYIDIGNLCNLRCPFCVTGAKENKTPTGYMTLDRFRVIFDRIGSYAQLVSLYNWGEPFMNPDLLEIIALAGSRGAQVHIDSNLSTRDFSDADCAAIIRSGLHTLFASIDGVTQATYQRYRVRGRIDRVFGNLERLAAAKARLGSDLPILGWQFHVSAYNEHEMDEAARMADALGIGIVFKRLNTPQPEWWSSLHERAQMVLRGKDWFNQTYTPPRNPDLADAPLHPAVSHPCGQLFATMTVAWTGDVMPCTCVEGPDYAMGNLFDTPLEVLWNGPQFRASRDFVLNYGPEQGGCSVCERLDCPITQKSLTPAQVITPVEAD